MLTTAEVQAHAADPALLAIAHQAEPDTVEIARRLSVGRTRSQPTEVGSGCGRCGSAGRSNEAINED